MSYIKAPKPREQKYYDFLERLRQSGKTNMFGASVWLSKAYGMKQERATAILADWMRGHSDPSRVIKKTAHHRDNAQSSASDPAQMPEQKVSDEVKS